MEDKEKIICFFNKHKKQIEENPLILKFLSNEDNLSLLKNYIINPTDKNKDKVNAEFQKHYTRVRKISYISNLIHFFSVDFDKKNRKQRERNLVILDKNSADDNETPLINLIPSNKPESPPKLLNRNLTEDIDNVELIEGLKTLTDKQLLILDMIYHKNIPQKEIADKLKTTPQNISNHHRKSLNKLKTLLNKGE